MAHAHQPYVPPPQQPTAYVVKKNTVTHRVLCKGCRMPIAHNGTQIGYNDRGSSWRWYHLGCLSSDRWRPVHAHAAYDVPHLAVCTATLHVMSIYMHALYTFSSLAAAGVQPAHMCFLLQQYVLGRIS